MISAVGLLAIGKTHKKHWISSGASSLPLFLGCHRDIEEFYMLFSDSSYEQQVFEKLSLSAESIQRKEFSNCRFENCDFGASDFSNSVFIDCGFHSCSFANTKFEHCRFQGVTFVECKLVGIAFARVLPHFLQWSFKQCKINFCNFGGLKMPHSLFVQSLVHETDFVNADLKEASFAGSDLKASKFHHTNLEKSNFVGARNYYIDPTSNRIKGAKFDYPEVLNLLAGFSIKIEA